MQHPVRYYIEQTDDQPVVRSVPVARPRRFEPASEAIASPTVAPPTVAPVPEPTPERRNRARVHRLVHAAIRREARQG